MRPPRHHSARTSSRNRFPTGLLLLNCLLLWFLRSLAAAQSVTTTEQLTRPNTNGLKLLNTGDKTPQAQVVAYNNTIVNAGWRRPTIKGGSIWLEVGVQADLVNNLLANDRFGIKRDVKKAEDKRSIVSNNLYYGFTAETVTNFQPSTEILTGTNDIMSKNTGDNDPKFMNYPLCTDGKNSTFNTAWDFRLQAGSPALGKGLTTFTRLYAAGLTVGGKLYQSPTPASYIGAYGSN